VQRRSSANGVIDEEGVICELFHNRAR